MHGSNGRVHPRWVRSGFGACFPAACPGFLPPEKQRSGPGAAAAVAAAAPPAAAAHAPFSCSSPLLLVRLLFLLLLVFWLGILRGSDVSSAVVGASSAAPVSAVRHLCGLHDFWVFPCSGPRSVSFFYGFISVSCQKKPSGFLIFLLFLQQVDRFYCYNL